jgi:hypothetical protein
VGNTRFESMASLGEAITYCSEKRYGLWRVIAHSLL